ncbi:MAG TPA: hypothetical protein VFH51_14560, partial [Myxococcota bacterium]|nr:hypothetical protein [Myxococcota bacterium]
AEVRVEAPSQHLRVDRMGAVGRLWGKGDALEAHWRLGLGDLEGGTGASHMALDTDRPRAHLTASQRLVVGIDAEGLGEVHATLMWRAEVARQGTQALPPTRAEADADVHLDLLGETIDVGSVSVRVGDDASVRLALAVESLFGAPRLTLKSLTGGADLDALGPLLRALAPQVRLGGKIGVETAPMASDVATLGDVAQLAAGWQLTTHKLRYDDGTATARDLDSTWQFAMAGGNLTVQTDLKLAAATFAAYEAYDIDLHMANATPIGPWLGKPPGESLLDTTMKVRLGRATSPFGTVRGYTLELGAQTPIALLKHTAGGPLSYTVTSRMGHARAPSGDLYDARLDSRGQAWDLGFSRADTRVELRARKASLPSGDATIGLVPLDMTLDVVRRGDDYDFRRLRVDAAGAIFFTMTGGVDGATGPAPHFRQLHMALGPFDIAAAAALMPKPPAAKLAGTLEASVDLDGTLAMADLAKRARPPALAPPGDADDVAWTIGMKAATDWLQAWVDDFEEGMPFTADLRWRITDMAFDDGERTLRGLSMQAAVGMHAHGPYLEGTLDIADVDRPTPLHGLHSAMA